MSRARSWQRSRGADNDTAAGSGVRTAAALSVAGEDLMQQSLHEHLRDRHVSRALHINNHGDYSLLRALAKPHHQHRY